MMLAPRSLRTAGLGLALAAACTLSFAQGAVSPAKRELLNKAMALQAPGIEGLGMAMANQIAGQALQLSAQYITRLPPEKREETARDIQAEVKKFHDEIAPVLREKAVKLAPSTLGQQLEEKFSEEELKTLIQWLESPVNKKFQQVAVETQQSLSQKVSTEARPIIEPKMKALEERLSARLRTAAGASAPAPAAKPATKK